MSSHGRRKLEKVGDGQDEDGLEREDRERQMTAASDLWKNWDDIHPGGENRKRRMRRLENGSKLRL